MSETYVKHMLIDDRRDSPAGTVLVRIVVDLDPKALAGVPVADWPAAVQREVAAAGLVNVEIVERTTLIDRRARGAQ